MKVGILGGTGFIGSHLATHLIAHEDDVDIIERGEPLNSSESYDIVYYCIGMTANFREHPFDTVDAHVSKLAHALNRLNFKKIVVLSSARIYDKCTSTEETSPILINPANSEDLYNITKLLSESLTLSCVKDYSLIRLSNVIGYNMASTNFVGSILYDANRDGKVVLRTNLDSEKDYIWIDDAVRGIRLIAIHSAHGIYNLAGGQNVTNRELMAPLEAAGIQIEMHSDSVLKKFPEINIRKLVNETRFRPEAIMPRYIELVANTLTQSANAKRVAPLHKASMRATHFRDWSKK